VEVRIGVLHTPKEIEVNLPDDTDRSEVRARIEAALANGDAVLWLTDRLGTEIAMPGRAHCVGATGQCRGRPAHRLRHLSGN
jgi:hypothetical protein